MRISDWSSDVCSSDLLGVDRQRPRQGDALAHAARKMAGVGVLETAKAVFMDQFAGAIPAFGTGYAAHLQSDGDVLEDRPPRQQQILLQHESDLRGRDRKSTRLNSSH